MHALPLLAGREEEVVDLCCELVSHRGSWPATTAGCTTLGRHVSMAVHHLCSAALRGGGGGGGSAGRSAEAVLRAVLEKRAAGKLCRCIQDAQMGAAPGGVSVEDPQTAGLESKSGRRNAVVVACGPPYMCMC